jgi:hypothetical protein
VVKFKYLGMMVTNQNYINREIKIRLNLKKYLLLFGLESFVFPLSGILCQNGIYQLQCGECPLKYVQANKHYNSTSAQHILESGHTYDTIDQTMEILHIERKGQKLNILERYYIRI